jgi:hypothetical protein
MMFLRTCYANLAGDYLLSISPKEVMLLTVEELYASL